MRQSSQASTWLPEGSGELVFKTLPEGPPPLAPFKADQNWNRSAVQTNVRRWLPHLQLSAAELQRAQTEWEAVFKACPSDVNSLPSTERLRWLELPRQRVAYVPPLDDADGGTCPTSLPQSHRLHEPP